MAQHNEVEFERELCEHLAANGWLYSPTDEGFDRQRALFPNDVFAWLEETQPEELGKRLKPGMSASAVEKTKNSILDRLVKVLDVGQPGGGTLHVLRNGFKDVPASFTMMQRRPDLAGNPTTEARYAANRLRVMRQVHYSTKNNNSIDLVLFVNGLPVATAELKTDFTQSVNDAKKQYRADRKPAGEPLLGFGTRALVHFAVSNDEVWMTTRLDGQDTRFLPFNRGNHGHAGNAPDPLGLSSPTAYLWQEVWGRDRWLEILSKFMHYETVTSTDPVSGKKSKSQVLIFPRYHQLDAVTKMLADVRATGPGQRYLIQHSAGSGKTRTIAWTAHRLATLHDQADAKVFDSVIVVTDRNVLDAQLQEAVKQIEAKDGFVATISTHEAAKKSFSSKSGYLTDTLSAGKAIIVVTLQTFPFVLQAIQENKALVGRRFAVIADEAHSSQTGMAASKLKQVLSAAEVADLADGGEVDVEAILAAQAAAKADTHNISFFAFTATPKAKTMEMFGTKDADGLPHPFHTYTMQQAIEEQFILDVLANYTSYDTAFQLAAKVQAGQMEPVKKLDDTGELVDESAATKGLMRWVKLHPTNIAQKVQIIVEHFEANVKHLLNGTAKAMIVTDSRKAAVRYKHAIDAYTAKHHYTQVASLVAFSGEVTFDDDLDAYPDDPIKAGDSFTEAKLNPGAGDLRKAFDTGEYRVMIVANKFQTGFDQPKLCAMYVDKQLSGVAAVQTLSRLNRFLPGKTTMVLDFVNDADEILAAFKPYFEEASMVATTDPNLIHDIGNRLGVTGMYTHDEVDGVATAEVLHKGHNAINAALQPVKQRYVAAYNAAQMAGDQQRIDELDTFRKDVGTYVRLYDFLSQVIDFGDTDVEKHAIFFRLLATQIRIGTGTPDIDLSEVQLVHIKQKKTADQQQLVLGQDDGTPLRPITAAGSHKTRDPRLVLLDEIIARLNEQYAGEDFRDDQQRSWIESLVAAMKTDPDLVEQAEVNSEPQFLASPTLRDAATLAVAETDTAHSRMTDLFHARKDIEVSVIESLGKLLYLDLHELAGNATG